MLRLVGGAVGPVDHNDQLDQLVLYFLSQRVFVFARKIFRRHHRAQKDVVRLFIDRQMLVLRHGFYVMFPSTKSRQGCPWRPGVQNRKVKKRRNSLWPRGLDMRHCHPAIRDRVTSLMRVLRRTAPMTADASRFTFRVLKPPEIAQTTCAIQWIEAMGMD